MSNLNAILDAVVTEHTTAALEIAGVQPAIAKRKLPKKEETVDQTYQVTISGVERVDNIRRIARGKYMVLYSIDMTLVTPNDRDALVNLVDHTNWREATRARYMASKPLASLDFVKRIDIVDSPFLDRSQLADGYDYDQITIQVWSFESR